MNFSEWYKFGTSEEQGCFMGDAEKGWNACKKEVLNILESNPIIYNESCAQGIIEKIENL